MQRGVLLLQNDLKSAVATLQTKNRLDLIPLHFSDNGDIKPLAEKLGFSHVYILPLPKQENELLTRMVMLKIAEWIAERNEADFIITGENIPLISSDSLQIMQILNKTVKKEILRPIFSLTEQEIKRIALEAGLPDLPWQPSLSLTETKDYEKKFNRVLLTLQNHLQQIEMVSLS